MMAATHLSSNLLALILALTLCFASCQALNLQQQALASHASDQEAIQRSLVKAVDQLRRVKELLAVRKLSLQDHHVSDQCNAAYGSAETATASCLAQITTIMSGVFGASPAEMTNSVQQYCTGGCAANITNFLVSVSAACNATELDELGNFEDIVSAYQAPCTQINGQYCFPQFVATFSSFLNFSGGFTSQHLDALCSPCTRKILQVLASEGTDINSAFETMCIKDNGQYCLLVFQSLQPPPSDGSSGSNSAYGAYLYRTYCTNRCFQLMANAALSNSTLSDVFDFYCAVRPDGTPCVQLMFAANTTVDSCPDEPSSQDNCTQACKTQSQAYLDNFGCCAGTLFAMFTSFSPSGEVDSNNEVRKFIEENCGITIAAPCAPSVTVTGKLAITNVKESYYQANQAEIREGLRNDIARAAAVNPENVNITSVAITSNGLDVQYTIKAPTATAAASIGSSLSTDISSGALTLETVASIPAAGKIDPTAPTGIDTGRSTVTVETTSTATSNIATLLLVAVLAVFAKLTSF